MMPQETTENRTRISRTNWATGLERSDQPQQVAPDSGLGGGRALHLQGKRQQSKRAQTCLRSMAVAPLRTAPFASD